MNQWKHRARKSLEEGAIVAVFFGGFAWVATALTPIALAWVSNLSPGPVAVGLAVGLVTGILATLRAWHMSW